MKDELKTEVKIKDEIEDSLLESCLSEVKVKKEEDQEREFGAGDSDYYDEDDNLPLVFAQPISIQVSPKATKRKYKG